MVYHIAFCCPVRNCARYLPYIFRNISLFRANNNYTISCIFCYDNCHDNTESLLLDYQKMYKENTYLITANNSHSLRTVRIANARNECIKILYNDLKNVDYHIMIDCDDVNIYKWDIAILNKYISNFDNDDWDCITFNRKPYYDMWAVLIDHYKHHCWGFGKLSKKALSLMKQHIKIKLSPHSLKKSNSIYCHSAYNGFAIYKTPKFKGILYDGFYSSITKLITDKEREDTFKYFREKHGMNIHAHDGSYVLDNRKSKGNEECCCEHIYYHLSAIKQNDCKIKISKFHYHLYDKQNRPLKHD